MKLLAYLAGLIAGICGYKIKPADPPKDGGVTVQGGGPTGPKGPV